ncbi:MAG: hypothetical protein R2712_18795 [Vicinamibacterales bacterium]
MFASLARALARRLCRARVPHTVEFPVARTIAAGRIDTVVIHSDRVLSVMGAAEELAAFRNALRLVIGAATMEPAHAFCVPRHDLPELMGRAGFRGAVVEWILPPGASAATLEANGEVCAAFDIPEGGEPAHHHLRTSPYVHRREDIYGSGPPVHEVAPDTLALARLLPEPILDFGCGGGALVRALRGGPRDPRPWN